MKKNIEETKVRVVLMDGKEIILAAKDLSVAEVTAKKIITEGFIKEDKTSGKLTSTVFYPIFQIAKVEIQGSSEPPPEPQKIEESKPEEKLKSLANMLENVILRWLPKGQTIANIDIFVKHLVEKIKNRIKQI